MSDDIFNAEGIGGVDDAIEGRFYNNIICLTIEEPWAGDSETGFGRSCNVRLSREDALNLAAWLIRKARKMEGGRTESKREGQEL